MAKIIRNGLICLLIILVVLSGTFYWGYTAGNRTSNIEYENRLAEYAKLYSDLQVENKRIIDLNGELTTGLESIERRNTEIADKVGRAKDIIGSIGSQVDGDAEIIQRLISTVGKLEQALQLLFEAYSIP